MSSRLDIDVITKMLQDPDSVAEFAAAGIGADSFKDMQVRAAVEFLWKYKLSYGSPPPAEVVVRETGIILSTETLGETRYYIDQIKERAAFDFLRHGMSEATEALKDGKTDLALTHLDVAVKAAYTERVASSSIARISDTEARVARFDTAKSASILGAPFPWKEFTETTLGWKGGEFGLITARTGIGKTFFGLLCAHAAWSADYRVLVISMEMAPDLLHIRHDALLSQVPLDALWKGKLTPAQEERYRETMADLKEFGGFDIVGHSMSASSTQIAASIELFKPQWVLIDGAYLVKPTGYSPKMNRNEKMEAVANDLTVFSAQYNIPIAVSLQLNREQKRGKNEAELENIYGSDAWAQNATYSFGLIQTKEDRADGVMRVSLNKHRNGQVFASRINWDLEDMAFDLVEFELGTTSISRKVVETEPVTW